MSGQDMKGHDFRKDSPRCHNCGLAYSKFWRLGGVCPGYERRSIHMALSSPKLGLKVFVSVRAGTIEKARRETARVKQVFAGYGIVAEFETEA